MIFHLSRQLLLFLVIGVAQLLLDWGVFVLLSGLGVPVVAANLVGRPFIACLGFWLNGRYTFADSEGRPRVERVHFGRFAIAWLLLAALSTLLMELLSRQLELQMLWLAKPAVEVLIAGIGFIVWRQWVYR